MSKKGFVLMETIVVIVVISVALLTLFSSYNKILTKVQSENKNDNPEYLYMTYYVKEYLKKYKASSCTVANIGNSNLSSAPTNYATTTYLGSSSRLKSFNIKKIHIISVGNGTYTENNLKWFDAYMIDYIKGLDIGSTDSVIIVEYEKADITENYEEKKMYKNGGSTETLYKTYIASLEW